MAISDRVDFIAACVFELVAMWAIGILTGWHYTGRQYVRKIRGLDPLSHQIMLLPLTVAQAQDLGGQVNGTFKASRPEAAGREAPRES